MVKLLLALLFFSSVIHAELFPQSIAAESSEVVPESNATQNTELFPDNLAIENGENALDEKIKSLIDEEKFYKNEKFIRVIFSPEEEYYQVDRVDVVKVVKTLKENGLLNLFFDKPQELQLSFKTNASPLFFVKIMGDTLRNIGYYRYVTTESNLDASEFTWVISLTSEYAMDPIILQDELQKSGARITDVVKHTYDKWEYNIDACNGYLNVPFLEEEVKVELKRSLYAHWLNVSKIGQLKIKTSFRDSWYPHISFYDKQLHLLEVKKRDKRTRTLYLDIPSNAEYIKISDIYTLKNVKDSLKLEPSGSR